MTLRITAAALAALVLVLEPVHAQAPTESAWRSLSDSWVEICVTPCRVANVSSFPARLAVGTAAPVGDDAAAAVLAPGVSGRDFGVAGLKVYGRALTAPTRVVVEPYADSGSAASATASGVTRSRRSCTLPAYAAGGNAVCTDDAGQQTTTACAPSTACLVAAASAGRRVAEFTVRTAGATVDIGYAPTVAPGNAKGIDGPSAANGQGGAATEIPAHVGPYYAASPTVATLVVVQGQ